jgi:hypothetical protein
LQPIRIKSHFPVGIISLAFACVDLQRQSFVDLPLSKAKKTTKTNKSQQKSNQKKEIAKKPPKNE